MLRNFTAYTKDEKFTRKRDKTLHLGLLPGPYSGNLATGRIFILLLNPGLSPLDYYLQQDRPVRTALVDDIHQKTKGRYPFPSLDPKFSWRPGARYWVSKLDGHVRQLMTESKVDYFKALSHLSRSICVLQLVPYYSRAFGVPKKIVSQLKSTDAVKTLCAKFSFLKQSAQNAARYFS